MAKKKPDTRGFIYSTDPNFHFEEENENIETLPPSQQKLRVSLDTRHRAGKAVTLIAGFIGKDEDLQELAKNLRAFCGTGGSAKGGDAIVQGDQRDKVMQWLSKNGYSHVKKL
jgi:translation initiation factor 1